MQMDSVLHAFRNLCDAPVAWVMLGLVALKAAHSVVYYFRCPMLHGGLDLDPRLAAARLASPTLHSPRFLVMMLLGMALSVGGLYTVQHPDLGHYAIAAIVIGVFVMLVEPSKLSIDENGLRVAAAPLHGPDAQEIARDRLRAAHFERVALEVVFVAGLGLVLALY